MILFLILTGALRVELRNWSLKLPILPLNYTPNYSKIKKTKKSIIIIINIYLLI